MGFVFKARQPHLDRFVALKLLPDKLAKDALFAERFNREGRVLARLNHPNIVSVYDFGQAGGFYYLAMEYVDGVNLRQAMRAGRFSPAEALALVLFSVLAAASLAVGPVIAKLRRLQVGVRQAAASHYEDSVTVEGRDEVAALAGAFNEAGRLVRTHLMDVQAREQALRVFVANTTHDVAIPLTVLQGHLTELDRELAAAPATREHVRAAMQEAHYMASLLRNLGAATRLDEAGALALLSPVDVSALVECVVTRHRPIARVSGVDLNVAVPDPPLVVSSDPTLLEQALSNLVDNAIRYNHAGGHVAVLLDGKADRFTLSVTDDGPGVTDEELARLTTRWFRGSEARTRRPDGKGLGLAIVAESVARVGLTLTFHRPESAGLRAEIQGPLWPSVRSPG